MDEAIDQLTGLLAADSLSLRARELAHQSRRCGEPVGLILGELEPLGPHLDAQLPQLVRAVAAALLDSLRAFDLAYRLAEERFLVLLPGADHERAADTAERLRCSVEAAALGATMSFGVGASREGWWFDYDSVLREAEAALAQARHSRGGVRAGRDHGRP
jgi:diguanylate cyclase (GGDEF)-like protein